MTEFPSSMAEILESPTPRRTGEWFRWSDQEPAENGGKSSECSRCKQDRSISIAEAVHGQSFECRVRDGTGEPAGQVSSGNVSDQSNRF
jgi:hypothetical protein